MVCAYGGECVSFLVSPTTSFAELRALAAKHWSISDTALRLHDCKAHHPALFFLSPLFFFLILFRCETPALLQVTAATGRCRIRSAAGSIICPTA